jgi:nucleoside-diphosphate-sugar epimerase
MTRSLVVGGLGFVGREIVRQLQTRGDDVVILDLLPCSDNTIVSIQVDLRDAFAVQQALRVRHFDVIYHVASFPGDTGDACEMMKLNVGGLLNMLEWARSHPVTRFVVTGSICAYGWYPATTFTPPKYLPVDEEYPFNSQDMKDMYSSTKRIQEILAMTYYHEYHVPTTLLRLTTVVGPAGKGGGRAWRDFARMLKEGKQVQIPYFAPEEVFHFVDIRDVARMHLHVAEHPKAVGEIFNCGSKAPTRGTEFIAVIKRLVPSIRVECGFPWSMAQGGELWFDISKAKGLLGFEPQYTFEDAIRSIKEWIDADGLEKEQVGIMDSKYGTGIQQ